MTTTKSKPSRARRSRRKGRPSRVMKAPAAKVAAAAVRCIAASPSAKTRETTAGAAMRSPKNAATFPSGSKMRSQRPIAFSGSDFQR